MTLRASEKDLEEVRRHIRQGAGALGAQSGLEALERCLPTQEEIAHFEWARKRLGDWMKAERMCGVAHEGDKKEWLERELAMREAEKAQPDISPRPATAGDPHRADRIRESSS